MLAVSLQPDKFPVAKIVPESVVHLTALAAAFGLAADEADANATVAIEAGISSAAGTRKALATFVRNIYYPLWVRVCTAWPFIRPVLTGPGATYPLVRFRNQNPDESVSKETCGQRSDLSVRTKGRLRSPGPLAPLWAIGDDEM